MSKMVVLDGNSLLYRAYFALPPFTASNGAPTGALVGFFNMLGRILSEYAPTHLLVAFDAHGPTFRHEFYADYKAGRPETPADLRVQFDLLKQGLDAMGIARIQQDGVEADDFLGCAGALCCAADMPCFLVTGDRDALQLVSDCVHVVLTRRGMSETSVYTPAVLMEEYGLTPAGMIDLKSLMGDASDRIPGVPGVGEKTALRLLTEYRTLDSLYENLDKISGKLGPKLKENRELCFLSRRLAIIRTDFDMPSLSSFAFAGFQSQGITWARGLDMNSLIPKLKPVLGQPAPERSEEKPVDTDLSGLLKAMQKAERLAFYHDQTHAEAYDGKSWLRAPLDIQPAAQLSLFDAVTTAPPWAAQLAPLWQKPLIVWQCSRLFAQCTQADLPLPANLSDVALAAYVVDTSANFANPEGILTAHAQNDGAKGLWQAWDALSRILKEKDSYSLYAETELPTAYVLWRMHQTGICVDVEVLKTLGRQLDADIARDTALIYQQTGVDGFNIASPKQLGQVLFETLGLPTGKKTKGGYSTDVSVLEGLLDQHPCIETILRLRQNSKLRSTYIEGLQATCKNGRIHTTFEQTQTATGRLSSVEPNLQNIPVRTPEGAAVRRAFVPRAPDWRLISADYSQIELRILAHYTKDPGFMAAFLQGQDIHRGTAAAVERIPPEEVTPAQRSAAKAVNFGIVYGISDFGLARQLGISRKEAAIFIEKYFDQYPNIKAWMAQNGVQAMAEGGACTLHGRRRTITELASPLHHVKQFGLRAALNTPIQGTAADIIKMAMVAVHDAFVQEGLRAQLLLQVHDELIVDAPLEEINRVCEILTQRMQNVVQLSVPLLADVHVATNWAEAK